MSSSVASAAADAAAAKQPAAAAGREITRATKGTEKTIIVSKIGGDFKIDPNPAFLGQRQEIFDRLLAKQKERESKQPRVPIKVTLQDGRVVEVCLGSGKR